MKKILTLFTILIFLTVVLIYQLTVKKDASGVLSAQTKFSYWLLLHRKSNIEFLYFGENGDAKNSQLIKIFKVKSGIPNQRPTPLPRLLGRRYWVITAKEESFDPETSPYFLTLDIPVSEEEPFGPVPYLECGGQCNWIIPGAFGLHGVNGDETRLSGDDPGSSGCIRHSDEDITFLYNILNPDKNEIRYYIEDI